MGSRSVALIGGGGLPPEIVVLSHLRWTFVWQRPQQILSRLGRTREVWFVEEPVPVQGATEARLRVELLGSVRRVWCEVPGNPGESLCFSDSRAAAYERLLLDLFGRDRKPAAWLYTPMALPLAEALGPCVLVYDVMDDLSAFKGALPELVVRQLYALRQADVVFTGGRSLHQSVASRRPQDTHCFPSGVDPDHYAGAIAMRQPRTRRVAGYVGVIDERLDLDLIAALGASLPDWEIRMVGPVVKIDPSTLPRLQNITYPGPTRYSDLPEVMGSFDVALMPFALNDATKSISPTKTLEYLAAGLPVVSTRIADVVSDFGQLVDFQEDGAGFAAACRRVGDHCPLSRAAKAEPLLQSHHWDRISARMEELIVRKLQVRKDGEVTA